MLVGRDPEREALAQLLDGARGGRSGVVAFVGETGIGKSSLLEDALELASGMRTLRARGIPSEAQIPFAALFELLRPALSRLDSLPEPQAAALESALALRPARATERFAVGAATLSLLAAYAEEQPVVVVVDDVQWLDGSTADALLFAVRRLLAEPIAVVLAAREGEPSFLGRGDLPVTRLGGIDAEAATLLVRDRAPGATPAFAARLHRETGGNPLALLELAGERLPAGAPDVPPPVVTSVAEAYLARVARLPERTREALLLAAVDRGDLAVLARAGARDGLVPEDLDAAADAGLVAVEAGRVEFRHPLLRAAVYGAATHERRRAVHRALAETLPDSDADRRAWHLALAAAGPDARASAALVHAARRAFERSAYDVASQAYERAARLAPAEDDPSSLLYQAANAAWLGGAPERTLALLEEAGRSSDAVELDHLHGHIALWRGPLREGEAVLRAAAAQADPADAVVMLAEAVLAAFYAADPASMREAGERAAALAGRSDDRLVRFFGLIAEGMALVFGGSEGRGAEALREAVRLIEGSDELHDDPRLLVWAPMGPLWLREAGLGEGLVDRALEEARARSAAGVLPHLLAHVAIHHATTDRFIEARAGFEEAIALARETGQRVVLAGALARLAWLEARSGRAEACRRHAAEALATAHEQGAALCEIWALAALRDLELGAGDVDAALEHAADQQRALDERGVADPDLSPAPEQVELLLRVGRAGEAEEIAEAFGRRADAKGRPWARARAARCRLLLAAPEDAARRYEEAMSLHTLTSDLFEVARTQLAHGARLRRDGERAQARKPLRAAVDGFDRLGAAPWSDAARAELLATGERARRRDPTSLAELTAQELQVSLLLAGGRTTREAAAALFLSPKTIEYHLRNVYRKLGIRSREELRAELERSEPTTAS
jgi:DNA-binding CsgD family transcriptional regulator